MPVLVDVVEDEESATMLSVSSTIGVSGSPFSFSFASKPSTRFSNASKTSVFGPLFFGTASMMKLPVRILARPFRSDDLQEPRVGQVFGYDNAP